MFEKLANWLFTEEERAPISYILAVTLIFCSIVVAFLMVHHYLTLRGVL